MIDTYYQNTAILHTPSDVVKLKKIIVVLSKIPFEFPDPLFFMQESRKIRTFGTQLYTKMQMRYEIQEVTDFDIN
jgi:hypothetical protein